MRLLRTMVTLAAVAALTLTTASPAGAIVGGALDGERHPNVGLMIGYQEGEISFACSGTLIAPTVFLTAAHCTGGEPDLLPDEIRVTFDTPVPLDPRGRPIPATYLTGAAEPHPLSSLIRTAMGATTLNRYLTIWAWCT